MHWIWWIILATVYFNVGYLIMWLGLTEAKKCVKYTPEDKDKGAIYTFTLSWKALLLAPACSLFEIIKNKGYIKGGQITIKDTDNPVCFVTTHDANWKLAYMYLMPVIWPIKLLWLIIFYLGVAIIAGVYYTLLYTSKATWHMITLPIRWLLPKVEIPTEKELEPTPDTDVKELQAPKSEDREAK